MPAYRGKGARLWLREQRRDKRRRAPYAAVWIIRDGRHQESTGCGADDRGGAERALARYISRKHLETARKGSRDPAQIPVADVLSLYATDVVPSRSRERETLAKITRLIKFFGHDTLEQINGERCRAYARSRKSRSSAREDLVVLRAAINHHRREGHCEKIVSVVLPEKSARREAWCTRSEIANLILAAWRYRETQKGQPTDRASRRHVARFILVAVYTGSRAGAVCAAALEPTEGMGWIDLDRGIFFRRPAGAQETKKRRTPAPLPRRLLAHLRRWQRQGQRFAVEWNGAAVHDCDKAFRNVARAAGLAHVTPHVLRHTAATWLMQLGADPWQAAEYLGMTLQTLLDNYGHHHPDYLKDARDAFDRAPQARHRRPGTGGEQSASTVRKIADFSR